MMMLVGVVLLFSQCVCAQALIQIREGPQNGVVQVVEGTFHQFDCECSNTSSIPFWSISETVYDITNLPVGHRVVEGGLLVFVTGDLNGTSYQCLHVDSTTLEPVTSGTAVLQVSPPEKLNATSAGNICRDMIHFKLYKITSNENGIYLSWPRPDCQRALRNYVVYLTDCLALRKRRSEPRQFIANESSIRIPPNVLTSDNLFSVQAFDVDGGCCATSGPTYLQTSAQPEDQIPFLVAENDTEENCYAYNSSSDPVLPPSCADGCCCAASRDKCPCSLNPFYICRNDSDLSSTLINNTRLYYERQQNCCHQNTDPQMCRTVSQVRTVIVGGPPLRPYLNSISRSATTLDISLQKPFSHFPITNYALEMTEAVGPVCNFNEGSNFTCNLSVVSLPLKCPPLEFHLIAYNKVGESKPSESVTIDLNITVDVDQENVTTTSAVVDITLPGDFFPVNGSGIKLNISLTQDELEYPTFDAIFFDKHDNTYRYKVTGLKPQTNYTVYPVVPILHIGSVNGDNEDQLPCPFEYRGTSFKTTSGDNGLSVGAYAGIGTATGVVFILIF